MEGAEIHRTENGSHHWKWSWLAAVIAWYTGTLCSAVTPPSADWTI